MNIINSEFENKYVVEEYLAAKLKAWLSLRCIPDQNYPAGIISSIYFDTRSFSLLREKINSDYLKAKVRLRWYSDPYSGQQEDQCFLEVKNRIGSKRIKLRFRQEFSSDLLSASRFETTGLLQINQILKENGVFLVDDLLPVIRIQYLRHRFHEPTTSARISLDTDIRVTGTNIQMLPGGCTTCLGTAVFEHKGQNSQLPATLHQLTAFGLRKASFSKYSACYNHLKRNANQD